MINFDNTLLTDVAKCKVMAVTKHVFGLRGKAEKIAADIGNAYHAGLELHFRGERKREISAKFEQEYDKVIPPGESPREERFDKMNCVKIMEKYVDSRPIEQFPFDVSSFEEIKGCALDGVGKYIFWVKQDMVGKDRRSGELSPVDHKTTGNMTAWWAKKFRLVSQLSGYCWFIGRETGQHVGLCYINGLEIRKIPDSGRRCKIHGVPYSQCGEEHVNFQLYRYTRSPEQLEKWKQDALMLAGMFEMYSKAFNDLKLLPYAPRDGAFNEGCVFCEFKEWCVKGFDPVWQDEYTVYDPWKPWEIEEARRIDL